MRICTLGAVCAFSELRGSLLSRASVPAVGRSALLIINVKERGQLFSRVQRRWLMADVSVRMVKAWSKSVRDGLVVILDP